MALGGPRRLAQPASVAATATAQQPARGERSSAIDVFRHDHAPTSTKALTAAARRIPAHSLRQAGTRSDSVFQVGDHVVEAADRPLPLTDEILEVAEAAIVEVPELPPPSRRDLLIEIVRCGAGSRQACRWRPAECRPAPAPAMLSSLVTSESARALSFLKARRDVLDVGDDRCGCRRCSRRAR